MEERENLPRLLTLRSLLCAAAEEKDRFERAEERKERAAKRYRRDASALTLLDRNFTAGREEAKRAEREKYERYRYYSGAFIGKTLIKLLVVLSVLAAVAFAVWAVGERSVFANAGGEEAMRIAIVAVSAVAGATAVLYAAYCLSGIVRKRRVEFREYVELCANDSLEAKRGERAFAERKKELEARAKESERLLREAENNASDGEENAAILLAVAKRRYPELPENRWEFLDFAAYALIKSVSTTLDGVLFRAENGKAAVGAEEMKTLAAFAERSVAGAEYRKEFSDAEAELSEKGIEISLTDALWKRRTERTSELVRALGPLVGADAVVVRTKTEDTALEA